VIGASSLEGILKLNSFRVNQCDGVEGLESEVREGYILTLMPLELYDDVWFDAILTLIDPGVVEVA
jgi:hypothetical protein